MICGVDTSSVLQAFTYTGKTVGIEEGLGDHIMMKLMKPFDTGLNVTTDIFLQTSVLPRSSKNTK